ETVYTEETGIELDTGSLKNGVDFGVAPFGKTEGSVEGDLVFISYGIVADSIKRNDLEGLNLSGKIAVMMEGPPKNIPKKAWDEQEATMFYLVNAVRSGAKALIYIDNGREKDPPSLMADYFSRRQIALESESENGGAPVPIIYMTQEGAKKLFAKSPVPMDTAKANAESNSFKGFALGLKAKIKMKRSSSKGTARNVAGYFEGSDPKLKAEAVLFSAHYDAYGKDNGKIYNGAADNALGTAEMLAVAEAFSKMDPKPKRSLVFLAVTGEEYGLYGSKYWAKNPTWDIKQVAGNLNLDGIGSEVYGPVKVMVGYGAEYSTLGKNLDDVAKAMGISVMPDPMPDEKVFLRSDHYSFVERGVPALMLLGGPEGSKDSLVERIKAWEKVHYHQPSDDVMEGWDWSGAQTVAQVMGIIGLRVANENEMPSWLPNTRFGKLKRGNTKSLPKEED
ncbi:MAG: M20/M25/M40 family metallo-hydrolase, partial [Pyrinomonadaceae bacterium]